MQYNILDMHHDHRIDDHSLESKWFWEDSDIPTSCLSQLINQFNVGSEIKTDLYNGWIPLDFWVWSENITLFYGIWTHNDNETRISNTHTWFLAVASINYDYCPMMMSMDEDRDIMYGMLQIDRGYSPLKWMFLNDPEKSSYFYNRMSSRLSESDLLNSNLPIDSFSEDNLLLYILKRWLPMEEAYFLPERI